MAMYVKDNKIYILVADSDAINSNRIKGSKNTNSITTNYCPPEGKEQNELFYKVLGDKTILKNKPIYLDIVNLKNYQKIMTTRIKNKFAGIFNGDMLDFDANCEELISYGNSIIADNLFFTGSRPYLQFNGDIKWKKFKSILYGEASIIVLESFDDKFIIYPLFRPLFSKINEINFDGDFKDIQSLDYNYADILERNLYAIHIKEKNTALSSDKPHICIGWSRIGDLTNVKKKDDIRNLLKSNDSNDNNTIGQWVCPIYDFVNDCQIGDYVIFSNNNLIHIGRITSNYYFRNEMPSNEFFDYKNTRDVEWIMKNIDRNLISSDLNTTLSRRRTFYKINDYKSAILDILNDSYDASNAEDEKLSIFDYSCSNKDGTNLIVYGTPGCGKSYYVEHTLLKDYRHNEEGLCIDAIRTTFYQDYTNTDFVGQIMPVVNGDKVTYEFNPGPFALALNKAIQNPDLPVALVIEELNRGNAASIFGDIFQLLDRENGISVYNITNVNIQKYLQEQNSDYSFEYIKLPSNLSIFATMNTSDQNVFTLDTAFKRRWKFEKLKNTFDKHSYATKLIPGMDLDWKEFCTVINNFIIESKDEITNSEDKQLGVYFIDEKGLRTENVTSDEVQRKEFAYKIFEYLWDDVVKYDRTVLFKDAKTLDDLIDNYVKSGSNDIDGKNVFVENIFKKNGN